VSKTPNKNKQKKNTLVNTPSKIKSLEKNPEINGNPHKHNKHTITPEDKKKNLY